MVHPALVSAEITWAEITSILTRAGEAATARQTLAVLCEHGRIGIQALTWRNMGAEQAKLAGLVTLTMASRLNCKASLTDGHRKRR